MAKKKAKVMLSSFSIILILIFGLGILSHVLPNAQFVGEEIVNGWCYFITGFDGTYTGI